MSGRLLLLVFAFRLLSSGQLSFGQLTVRALGREVVENRVQQYKGNDSQREATLKGLFESAGCKYERLSEQAVKGLKQPNLICSLPGETDSIILVGAHYDHVDDGDGVVDNWSGASLLPSFYQVLSETKQRHTLIFAAFAGEEKGLAGSKFYVKNLAPSEMKKIRAMVCIDTLGLGPTEVWVSRSDEELVKAMAVLAHAMNLPVTRVDVDGVGYSDEESFVTEKIPVVVVHSITPETLGVLHSSRDKYHALKFDDYYASYRLLSGYLSFIDQVLDREKALTKQPSTQ